MTFILNLNLLENPRNWVFGLGGDKIVRIRTDIVGGMSACSYDDSLFSVVASSLRKKSPNVGKDMHLDLDWQLAEKRKACERNRGVTMKIYAV